VVINADKVRLTGNKINQKVWYRHSGYPGSLRKLAYDKLMNERPATVVEKAVQGMLPRNRIGRSMASKLKVYAGAEHPHAAQNPSPLDLNSGDVSFNVAQAGK
ncbi:MAG: 50S ribosomal protein L13, partial [Actinomycetota bacterium]